MWSAVKNLTISISGRLKLNIIENLRVQNHEIDLEGQIEFRMKPWGQKATFCQENNANED